MDEKAKQGPKERLTEFVTICPFCCTPVGPDQMSCCGENRTYFEVVELDLETGEEIEHND